MERTAVSSSNIAAIGYEADTLTLEVEFRNGSVYQYHGVPPETFDSFMQASSKGAFLNTNIRNSYGHTKL